MEVRGWAASARVCGAGEGLSSAWRGGACGLGVVLQDDLFEHGTLLGWHALGPVPHVSCPGSEACDPVQLMNPFARSTLVRLSTWGPPTSSSRVAVSDSAGTDAAVDAASHSPQTPSSWRWCGFGVLALVDLHQPAQCKTPAVWPPTIHTRAGGGPRHRASGSTSVSRQCRCDHLGG